MKSKQKFEIELFAEYEKVNLYSICFENEKFSEFENFMRSYKDQPKFKKDYELIIYWIKKITEIGALERCFKPESKLNDNVCAIPIPLPDKSSKLRLYCLRLSDDILIIGNGGVKNTRNYNNDLHLNECVNVLSNLHFFIKNKVELNKIQICGKTISGDLSFYIKNTGEHKDEKE